MSALRTSSARIVTTATWGGGEGAPEVAPVLPTEVRGEYRNLALELVDGSVNVRLFLPDTNITGEVARWQVVRTVEDDVVRADQIDGIGRAQSSGMNVDFNPGVDAMQTFPRGIRLLATDIVCSVQELPVKITEIDNIIVHDPKCAYAGGSEVKGCG